MKFLSPTLPKAFLTLILLLVISQLAGSVGIVNCDSDSGLRPVIRYHPELLTVYYTVRPVLWLPVYYQFRNSPAKYNVEELLPYVFPYWLGVSYILTCTVFWLPSWLKSLNSRQHYYHRPDHFSG